MQVPEVIRRRKLPHWDVPTAAYFVTTCLEGSIPARGLLDIAAYRTKLGQRPRPADQTDEQWAASQWKMTFARVDQWLDGMEGTHHLKDERLAQVVVDAILYFAGERYELLGFVVMPSHFHWVFQPLESWVSNLATGKRERTPRQRIIHSINRETARRCNQLLGHSGAFWQHESYDHWIRSPEELERILAYVEENPVKGRLVQSPHDWRFSSAWYRRQQGLELGVALRGMKPPQ